MRRLSKEEKGPLVTSRIPLVEPETCASFDDTNHLVLRYADVLTRENRVDDMLYAALEKRFPKIELLDIEFYCRAVQFGESRACDVSDRSRRLDPCQSRRCPDVPDRTVRRTSLRVATYRRQF